MARAEEEMDAKIWGELQNYIDLKVIYGKLPMIDFFQLRLVCKDWNQLASNRQFLEDSFRYLISEEYFIMTLPSDLIYFLAYDTDSSRWEWTQLPPPSIGFAGVLYNIEHHRIFNVHTSVFSSVPKSIKLVWGCPTSGMMVASGTMVDTFVNPYSFRIIASNVEVVECDKCSTDIYNSTSNFWTERLTRQASVGPTDFLDCASCNGFLYMKVGNIFFNIYDIEYYNIEKNEWGLLQAPKGHDILLYNIGAWQNNLFCAALIYDSICTVTVWKLTDHSKQKWTEFDRMPEHLHSWLHYDDECSFVSEICAAFGGEYVLFYTWLDMKTAERFVMCSLDKKVWEKIDVPPIGLEDWLGSPVNVSCSSSTGVTSVGAGDLSV